MTKKKKLTVFKNAHYNNEETYSFVHIQKNVSKP